MTTTYSEDVRCAVCGKSSAHIGTASTNAFGSADLDTRPPEMQRSTISTWVQECPECGYCARSIDKPLASAEAVITRPEYRSQLTSTDYPQLANAFLCQRMISEDAGSIALPKELVLAGAVRIQILNADKTRDLARPELELLDGRDQRSPFPDHGDHADTGRSTRGRFVHRYTRSLR